MKRLLFVLLFASGVVWGEGSQFVGVNDGPIYAEVENIYHAIESVRAAGTASSLAGAIVAFGGSTTPTGYLSCDGTAVSRTTYSTLFAAIGTTWGAGDGSTTFNLPSLNRRALIGSGGTGTTTIGSAVGSTGGEEKHTQIIAELAAHSHTITDPGHSHTMHQAFDNAVVDNKVAYGARGNAPTNQAGQIGNNTTGITIDTTGSGTAFNVMQPSAVVLFIIKT